MKIKESRIMVHKFFAVPLMIFVLFAAFTGYSHADNPKPGDDIYDKINKNLDEFGNVYKEVALNYVDDIDMDKFVKAGIDGMLSTLDPYTVFYDEDSRDQIDLITTGKYGGVGITVEIRDSILRVTDVMSGYEAQRKGIRVGDKIIEIDGQNTLTMDVTKLRYAIRGPVGTPIQVKIERDDNILDVTLIREEISLKNVSYYGYLNDDAQGIGYIKLDRFTRNAENEIETIIKSLKTSGNLRGVVLDLRNNGGGLLEAATGILNKLVKKNSLLVITKGKQQDSEKKYFSKEDPLIGEDVPIVVLINENTASASEIVAGAIQDLDRGVIVGSKSFGKGLVQQVKDINNDTQLKITNSRYFTPSGRWIQGKDYFTENKSGVFLHKEEFSQKEFRTLNGRTVYANGGITPDVEVDVNAESEVHQALLNNDMFFKYANYYLETHPGSNAVIVDEAVFQDFKNYLSNAGFNYESKAEKKINELKGMSGDKDFSSDYMTYLDKLIQEVDAAETGEIETAKEEIMRSISEEINKRLVEEFAQIEATFSTDKELQRAVSLINDSAEYYRLLSR
jgi:carboxyl-terminal processing protease